MQTKPFCLVAASLFALVAAAHLLRALLELPVAVGSVEVPVAVSWFGFIVPGALAAWGFRLAGQSAGQR